MFVIRKTTNRPKQYLVRALGDHKSPITLWHHDRALACNLSEHEALRIAALCQKRADTAAQYSAAKREPEGIYGVEPS